MVLVVLALIEGMAAPLVVIVVIGVGRRRLRVGRHGHGHGGGGGGVSERIPRRVITRKHFHAAESASKLIPGSVSPSISLSLPLPRSIGRLHRDCRRR